MIIRSFKYENIWEQHMKLHAHAFAQKSIDDDHDDGKISTIRADQRIVTDSWADIYWTNNQTCTDSPFFRFMIHQDSFDSNWIQLFIDSFITEIL